MVLVVVVIIGAWVAVMLPLAVACGRAFRDGQEPEEYVDLDQLLEGVELRT